MANDFVNCARCEKICWLGSAKSCEECDEWFCQDCDVCKDEKDCDTPKKYSDIRIAKLKDKIKELQEEIKKVKTN